MVGFINAHQKDELCDKQVDAKILVYGVPIPLEAAEEAESEDTNGEADQGDDNAHPCDDSKEQFMHLVFVLQEIRAGHYICNKVIYTGTHTKTS